MPSARVRSSAPDPLFSVFRQLAARIFHHYCGALPKYDIIRQIQLPTRPSPTSRRRKILALIMAANPSQVESLEIAHVLFMDIVRYSAMPMDQQRQVIARLQKRVRATAEFVRAQSRQRLIPLPTGDGLALVFFGDPEAPVRCAIELSRALREEGTAVRMGVHTGPVYRIADINSNHNVSGGGINLAQRVMDCGDAGHILVSAVTMEFLKQLGTWSHLLHDLGETQVKHGLRIHLFNVFADD